MSIKDGKFEVYVVGYSKDMNYINKKYINDILEKRNFNLCERIEVSDFILLLNEYSHTDDALFSEDYATVDYIDIAENLEDLLRLRDEYLFRESAVN